MPLTIKERVEQVEECCNTTKDNILPILQALKDDILPNLNVGNKGEYKLNKGWNFVAINVRGVKVADYFVKRLNDKYNTSDRELIDVCNAFIGHSQDYVDYVPGKTTNTMVGNFPLVIEDDDHFEIQPFFVFINDYSDIADEIIYTWDSADGNKG